MQLTDEWMKRVEQEAWYMIENQATVWQVAAVHGVGKSTVYRDLTKILPMFNGPLYREVQVILKKNKDESPARGGEATKRKHKNNL